VGNTVAAAVTNRRVLESVEANIALIAGAILAAIAALSFKYPRGIAYPLGLFAAWLAAAILYRAIELYRNPRRTARPTPHPPRDQDTSRVQR
jgi:cardiolipin synthase